MPRRKRIDRPTEKTISLPESLVAQVDLLMVGADGKVPYGAWSEYVASLIAHDLTRALPRASAMTTKVPDA